MNANDRRENILKYLKEMDKPVKGAQLAKKHGVSRQVVVQDMAILRAEGYEIIGGLNGYEVGKKENGILKIINSVHRNLDSMIEELEIIVDNGGKILDVIVEHPVYGNIKADLMIANRKDIKQFINQIRKNQAEVLSTLTGGEHMHTIEVESEEMFEEILKDLKEKNLLK